MIDARTSSTDVTSPESSLDFIIERQTILDGPLLPPTNVMGRSVSLSIATQSSAEVGSIRPEIRVGRELFVY